MKIVIAGGDTKAEFIISMFKSAKHDLIVINPSDDTSERLVKKNREKVFTGNPWRRSVLEDADAFDADIFLALSESDTDNYASCLMAKRVFNAKKTICVVDDPRKVEVYRKLGIDTVISSTYLLAQSVSNASSVSSLTRRLSLDDDRINVVESVVFSNQAICYKAIKDIHFPKYASISAIYRSDSIIIPSGLVILKPKDTLMMVTAPNNVDKLLRFVQTESTDTLSQRKKLAEAFQDKEFASDLPAPKKRTTKTKK